MSIQRKIIFLEEIPLFIAYIAIGMSYGVMAKLYGLPEWLIVGMSLFVYAGASQFVAAGLIYAGVNPFSIIITVFMVNLRHLILSMSYLTKFGKSKFRLAILPFLTDESYATMMFDTKGKFSSFSLRVKFQLLLYLSWNLGTSLGIYFADDVPKSVNRTLAHGLYAIFVAILVSELRSKPKYIVFVPMAVALNYILSWVLPIGPAFIITCLTLPFLAPLFNNITFRRHAS